MCNRCRQRAEDGRRITETVKRTSVLRALSCALGPAPSVQGFTLVEMLVGLAIGTLIIGAVMGLISESLRYKVNLNEKAYIQPILESAAQVILADPVKAMDGFVRLGELEGSPEVGVSLLPVTLDDQMEGGGKSGRLYRVMLNFKSASLEFSIIIPNEESK